MKTHFRCASDCKNVIGNATVVPRPTDSVSQKNLRPRFLAQPIYYFEGVIWAPCVDSTLMLIKSDFDDCRGLTLHCSTIGVTVHLNMDQFRNDQCLRFWIKNSMQHA